MSADLSTAQWLSQKNKRKMGKIETQTMALKRNPPDSHMSQLNEFNKQKGKPPDEIMLRKKKEYQEKVLYQRH